MINEGKTLVLFNYILDRRIKRPYACYVWYLLKRRWLLFLALSSWWTKGKKVNRLDDKNNRNPKMKIRQKLKKFWDNQHDYFLLSNLYSECWCSFGLLSCFRTIYYHIFLCSNVQEKKKLKQYLSDFCVYRIRIFYFLW